MANQFGNIQNSLGILKNYYAGPVVTQFNDNVPLYKAAEKGKEKYSGLQVVRSIKVRRNPGIGATSDGGNLPSIGKQTTINATIAAKYNYLRFGITAPMIKASSGDKGAFISAMEFEMNEGLEDFKNDMNRQMFWNGRGDLATVNAAAIASNVITAAGRTSLEAGNKYLDVGIVLDCYDANGVQKFQGVAINSISGTSVATLTLSAAVTVASGDILVRANSYNMEVQGLLTTLDGGTSSIYGVDRSLYPIFNGSVVNAGNGQMTLNGIQQTINEPRRLGGKATNACFTDFDSERYYTKLLVADKRYIGEKVKGDGTFLNKDQSYLEIAGVPLMADKDCPGSHLFFLASEGWKKYILGSELEWADETGSYMIAQSGADAFEVRLRNFANTFMEKPVSNALYKGYVSP